MVTANGIPTQGPSRWRAQRVLPWLLAGLVVLAYANSLRGVFLLDDARLESEIRSGAGIRRLEPRIVCDITFWLNYQAPGDSRAALHAGNVAIHLAAALLLLGLVRRTVSRLTLSWMSKERAAWFAFFSASLWALHPLTTQAVTYVCQRYESLAGMLMLAVVYAFRRGVEASGWRRRAWHGLGVLSCALGMGVKESMVVTPVLVLLYDALFVVPLEGRPVRSRGALHGAHFLTIAILILIQWANWGGYQLHNAASRGLWAQLLTQSEVVSHYIRLAFVPVGQCFDYGWPTAQPTPVNVAQAMALGALILGTVQALVRRRPYGYPAAWSVLILAMSSSLYPIADAAVEHRMYTPLMGLAVLAVGGMFVLVNRLSARGSGRAVWRAASVLGLAVLLVLTGLTMRRNAVYASSVTLWRDTVERSPGNLRARNDLAVALAEAGAVAEAMRECEIIVSLVPPDLRHRLESGAVVVIDGFRNNSYEYNYFLAKVNRGSMAMNILRDLDEAERCYRAALRVAPGHPRVRGYLRNVLKAKGMANAEIDAAIEEAARQGRRTEP